MPELPEVETTRRGLEPLLTGRRIEAVTLRTAKLRWPLEPELGAAVCGQRVVAVKRRAKYLLLELEGDTLLLHLGMSGSLRVVPAGLAAGKHDHIDLRFDDGMLLRFQDPRKFGALLRLTGPAENHPLLRDLGPEPLAAEFDGEHLYAVSRQRRLAVKPFIMDQKVVVGVGNIYANEALFRAGIRPDRAAGSLGRQPYRRLAEQIRLVLGAAIRAGGTTLQDFAQADGRPGYFRQELQVYGRGGEPCLVCGRTLAVSRLGQRSTFFCRHCQR